jgi:hypothetical protein
MGEELIDLGTLGWLFESAYALNNRGEAIRRLMRKREFMRRLREVPR